MGRGGNNLVCPPRFCIKKSRHLKERKRRKKAKCEPLKTCRAILPVTFYLLFIYLPRGKMLSSCRGLFSSPPHTISHLLARSNSEGTRKEKGGGEKSIFWGEIVGTILITY